MLPVIAREWELLHTLFVVALLANGYIGSNKPMEDFCLSESEGEGGCLKDKCNSSCFYFFYFVLFGSLTFYLVNFCFFRFFKGFFGLN